MRILRIAFGLIALTVIMGAQPASALDAPVPDPEVTIGAETPSVTDDSTTLNRSDITPAELQDLTFFAEQEGVPIEVMIERFAGVSEFTVAVDAFRQKNPDGFVYAEWGDGEGLMIVRPGYVSSAQNALHANSAKGTVLERDLPTEVEREALAEEVGRSLPRFADGGVLVHVDPFGLGVDVQIGTQRPTQAASFAVDAVRAEYGARGIDLHVVYSDSGPRIAAQGGMKYSGCTGAFIVKQMTSWGISTAHHCTTKPSLYDSASTGSSGVHYSRDVRVTRLTSGTHQATFRWNWNAYRAVTSFGDPVSGSPVCKFGKTTGMSCDVVTTTGNCVTYEGFPQFCGLFKTDNSYTDDGDSGGPWFYGNKALGITSGRGWTLVDGWDLFSGTAPLGAMGWTVYTG